MRGIVHFTVTVLTFSITSDMVMANTCIKRGGVCGRGEIGKECPNRNLGCPDGMCCQISGIQKRKPSNAKQKCPKSSPACKKENGSCQAKSSCPSTALKNLCEGGSCYCCMNDVPACQRDRDCALPGGFCVHKREYCTDGVIMEKGCAGSNCFCCIPNNGCKCSRVSQKQRGNSHKGGRKRRKQNNNQKNNSSTKTKYSWLTSISLPGTKGLLCSGVIINNMYVLTAAHCLFDKTTYDIYPTQKIRVNLPGGSPSRVKVDSVIIHNDFCIFDGQHNIALLRLKSRLDFTSRGITPLCLPDSEEQFFSGTVGSATGWAKSKRNNNKLPQSIKVIPKEVLKPGCNGHHQIKFRNITENQICAIPREGSTDCLGTSGVPLTATKKGKVVLVGIASFSEGCGTRDQPSSVLTVYTRVTEYLSWVAENTRGALYCLK